MKEIEVRTLTNKSLNEFETYEVITVEKSSLDAAFKNNGTDELRDLIRKSIYGLFNGDMLNLIGNVEQADIDYCINELAKGHASNIGNEDFWWSDECKVHVLCEVKAQY